MTPDELKDARHKLGLTLSEMASALGYSGRNAKDQVRKMESGKKTITDSRALMAQDLMNK